MEFSFIYMTASSVVEGRLIARALVEARLAACANVIENMNAFYWWEGEVQDGREVVIVAKTRTALVDRLIARVRDLHSNDCPCVVAIPLAGGDPAFLDWIAAETAAVRS